MYSLFPLVHPGSTLAEAFPVLFFPFARRNGCGERKRGGPFAPSVREGKENPEEGGPGSTVGSVQLWVPSDGLCPSRDRGLLHPDVTPRSSAFPCGASAQSSSRNEPDFFELPESLV